MKHLISALILISFFSITFAAKGQFTVSAYIINPPTHGKVVNIKKSDKNTVSVKIYL